MGRSGATRTSAFIDDLVGIGCAELDRVGFDKDKAGAVMLAVADAVCFRYARSILYVPANLEAFRGPRDQQIFQQHGQDGPEGASKYSAHRVAQLAEEHQMTTVHIYAILKKEAQRMQANKSATTHQR